MLENKDVKLISIEDIVPNRFQPRQIFGEKELKELADSIKEHGIIQPLLLRPLGDKYEIIAGERRYKAASIAGLSSVPAVIVEKDDTESAEIAIVENVQRKDLSPIEEAKSYRKLIDTGLKQDEVAKKLGVAQSTVANKLRLLSLTKEVQDALLNNKISERHARGLLKLESSQDQIELLNRIIDEKLTVRQTEEEIDNKLGYDKPLEDLQIPVFEEKIPTFGEVKPQEEKKNINNVEVLNPFNNNNEILPILNIDDEEIEKFDKDDINEILPFSEEKLEKTHDYLNTVYKARDFIESIKSQGLKVSSEEYDMGSEYQIIIKIEK